MFRRHAQKINRDASGKHHTHKHKHNPATQVSATQHAELESELLYLNHSCDPSVHLDTRSMTLRALRDLAPGDELSFFYPATEWAMAQPFRCWCGAARCLGQVLGASQLPVGVLAGYELNEHIRELLRSRDAAAGPPVPAN